MLRFREQIVHCKLLRFVNVRMIDLCVDVEKTLTVFVCPCVHYTNHMLMFLTVHCPCTALKWPLVSSLYMSKMLLLSAPSQSY